MTVTEEREAHGPPVSLRHKHNSCLCVVCLQNILSISTRHLCPHILFLYSQSAFLQKWVFCFLQLIQQYLAITWWQGSGGRKGRPPAGCSPHVSVWGSLEPFPGPCLQINEKVFQKDGRARREAPVSTSLKSLNCCTSSWLHSKVSECSSTSLEIVLLYCVPLLQVLWYPIFIQK